MPRVLVIDDQAYVRAAICAALKACGFYVVAVENGRLGLSALNESDFDLVIVDIYMPEMDGMQLIKALRQFSPNLPVIAMSGAIFASSGRTMLDVFSTAPHLASVTCLKKPFRPKELLDAVQNAISGAAVQ